jgi:hypothetical protein
MTLAFGDFTVTTIGSRNGRFWWRARSATRAVEFIAKRSASVRILARRGQKALRSRP